ncbi:MAG: hypothetical protein KJ915_00620 [Candidatus Omnitrophica bacterium]|nr:hypothetical protein [Candidatus Omnitrophota bacterium]
MNIELNDLEKQYLEKIVASKESKKRNGYELTILKLVFSTILFFLAYHFRLSKVLIVFLLWFWLSYMVVCIGYIKTLLSDQELIYKLWKKNNINKSK